MSVNIIAAESDPNTVWHLGQRCEECNAHNYQRWCCRICGSTKLKLTPGRKRIINPGFWNLITFKRREAWEWRIE